MHINAVLSTRQMESCDGALHGGGESTLCQDTPGRHGQALAPTSAWPHIALQRSREEEHNNGSSIGKPHHKYHTWAEASNRGGARSQ